MTLSSLVSSGQTGGMFVGFFISLVVFVPAVTILNRLVARRFSMESVEARRHHALLGSLIQLLGVTLFALMVLAIYWLGGIALGYEIQKEMVRTQAATPVPLPFLIYVASTLGAAFALVVAPFSAVLSSTICLLVGLLNARKEAGYFAIYQATSAVATLLCFWVFCAILTMGQ